MSFSPIPHFSFGSVMDISPGFLNELGVRFLMLDLDNTLAGYSDPMPSDDVVKWAENMASCGVKLFIVSNNRLRKRPESFAKAMSVGYVKSARKPSPVGLLLAMKTAGFEKSESALAGDQVYTDALAANRAGILSIIVRPRSLKNPLFALRYALELPFRTITRNLTRRPERVVRS